MPQATPQGDRRPAGLTTTGAGSRWYPWDVGSTPYASVDHLIALIGPRLERQPRADWPAVQQAIGSVLPGDFKSLVEVTGPIHVGQFLGVFAPCLENRNLDILVQMGTRLGALQVLKRDFGSRECPYPLWFEPGGLLPWGASDNGDTLFWLTRGHPDQWTVVVNESRGPEFESFPLCTSDFLVEWLAGRLKSRILARSRGKQTVHQVGRARSGAG